MVRSVKGGFDKVMIEKVGVKALERRQDKKQKERDSNTSRELIRSCVESIVSGSLPRTQTVSEISGDRIH